MIGKKQLRNLFISLLLLGGSNTQAGVIGTSLDIQLFNGAGLTPSQLSLFSGVVALWEFLLPEYQVDNGTAGFDGVIQINASGVAIDGVGGILGSAGYTSTSVFNGFEFAETGIMQFDTADLADLEASSLLDDVIFHEIAHVLGFGTLWQENGVYINNSGQYTGAFGLAVYQAEFDPLATFIPVDIVSGPGTANAHWDQGWAGGNTDILTGFLNPPTYLSDTSLASFEDIGFISALTLDERIAAQAVPSPSTLLLLLVSFGFIRHRKHS